ncbi:ABC transporter permease [Patescibacteria group bacterium]|nr:ABC transporter permease [Patescibacteria group bacterium]MBU1931866.1 ABC transporter permease [Patescibacteria group bacterium]
MEFSETVRLALGSLKSNKLRSFLTMLGIIIGVASVILLVSIGSGLKQYITQQFEELGSNLIMVMPGKIQFSDEGGREGGPPGVATNKLTLRIANKIQQESEYVKTALPIVTKSLVAKYGNNSHPTGIIASTEQYTVVRSSEVSEGRDITKAEVASAKRVTIIGPTLKEKLFADSNPVGKKISLADQKYTIIGVFKEKGATMGQDMDDMAFISITAASKQFNIEKLNYIYVESTSADDTVKTATEVKKILLKEMDEEDFTIMDSKDLLSSISSILSVLTIALGGIAGISLLVGGIGIMNIMLVSVTERTKEIGLRKAVGARETDISSQFLIEAVVLSLAGGLIGIILGFIGSLILGHFLKTAVTLWSVLLAFGVSAAVGILFGFAPAAKAAKLDPIEALHYE